MTKKQKIDFINEVNDRFVDARNHGRNGNSWWYPISNTMAYNVKMHSFGDVDTLRKFLTDRQNDFYTDEDLNGQMSDELAMAGRDLSDNIDADYGVKSGFAGRSGGWLEVEYNNQLVSIDENGKEDGYTHDVDINYYYNEAKKLDKLENEIKERIKKEHADLNKYIDTPEYYKDIAENCLYSDEDIADYYKAEIKKATDKLK